MQVQFEVTMIPLEIFRKIKKQYVLCEYFHIVTFD